MSELDDQFLLKLFGQHMKPLEPFLQGEDVQEVMINSPENIWVEQRGVMRKLDIDLKAENVAGALTVIGNIGGSRNPDDPYLDARTPGLRIAAVMYPKAVHGHAMAIRKHSRVKRTIADYAVEGLLDRRALPDVVGVSCPELEKVAEGGRYLSEFLAWLMASSKNVLVSGGTSTGKTTLINALIDLIPKECRLVVLEDTHELMLGHPNLVQIECPADSLMTMQRGIKAMLRFRPDRPVIGEVRDATAYDFLDALNTGHAGGICSLHADSAEESLYRIEDLVRQSPKAATMPITALRRKIASAINYVIQASRWGKERFPLEVVKVDGLNDKGEYAVSRLYYRFF